MANITSTFVKNIKLPFAGVNYLLEADLDIDLDTGDIVAIDNLEGWVCDIHWESVVPKTSNFTFAEFDCFQDSLREAAKAKIDLFDLRLEHEDL